MHGALLNVLLFAALAHPFLPLVFAAMCIPPLLLLVGDGTLGTLAGTGVGLTALAADGQALR